VFDPATDSFQESAIATDASLGAVPGSGFVAGSQPQDQATGVPVGTRVAIRFARPADVSSIHAETIWIEGPDGRLEAAVVAAEGGQLAFVTPATALGEGRSYAVVIDGLREATHARVPAARLAFTTEDRSNTSSPSPDHDPEVWSPSRARWRSDGADSPWRRLPPLQAPAGTTALAGQVLLLSGRPLAGVTLEIDGTSVETDRSGRFLLTNVPGGWHELVIDGRSASRGRRRFGRFEYGLTIVAGRTNVLPFTIWMPVLDTARAVRIPSPTTREVVVTTPLIPGLELHIPPGTTITDEDGKVVREVSITPIPVDRPPFPLPNGVQVPIYFTIQPGGAYVHVGGARAPVRRATDGQVTARIPGAARGSCIPTTRTSRRANGCRSGSTTRSGTGGTSTATAPSPATAAGCNRTRAWRSTSSPAP
jgi:hypothetical protein